MVIHALMRPLNPKIKNAPHEPVTVEYFQHECSKHALRTKSSLMLFAQKKHSRKELKIAKQKAIAEESTMKYSEILKHRGKIFFHFLKVIPTVDNLFFPDEIDNHYLIDGIRALCEFRLKTHKGGHTTNGNMFHLSDTFAHHLMRAIDTTGNRVLSEEEFLEFLMSTRETKNKKAKELVKSDHHYRSVKELVVLLNQANEKLRNAGLLIENEENVVGGDTNAGMKKEEVVDGENPIDHLEKAREDLLARIGGDVVDRDQALSVMHNRLNN